MFLLLPLLVVLVGLTAVPAMAQPKPLTEYDLPGLENRISLTSLDPWDVVQLIEFLAHRGGLNNIVIGRGVQGLTTKLKFEEVTVGDALEVVLSVNNLAYEIRGGIVTIMTDEEYQSLHGTSFYDNKKVKALTLQYADPVRVAAMLEPVKSTIGTVVSDQVTGTLILIDTPDKIAQMEDIIERTDIATVSRQIPTETQTFVLQYADVAGVQSQIQALLGKESGSIRSDERTRTLMVTDLPHTMRKVEALVSAFDRRPRQVFIEAKIVQVALNDDFRMGVNWDHIFEGIDPRSQLTTVASPGAVIGAAGTLSYKTIAFGGDLNVVLEALQTVGETKTLSNPHVAVLDGEEATVNVVTDEPYVETRTDAVGEQAVGGTAVKFVPVGTSLAVTPRITDHEMIMTSIRPEISDMELRDFSFGLDDTGTAIVNPVPVVSRSTAETKVLIRSGETVIVAGMIKNQSEKSETRVPILGRIPLLGALFRSQRDSVQSQEIIAFLTPRIVTGETPHQLTRSAPKQPKGLRQR